MPDKTPNMVEHPPHYKSHPSGLECIQITRDMGFSAGNAVKYIWRTNHKSGRQDLEKARWYLNDAIDNGGRIFTGSNCEAWRRRLETVIASETGTARQQFFNEIRTGSLAMALMSVELLLNDPPF